MNKLVAEHWMKNSATLWQTLHTLKNMKAYILVALSLSLVAVNAGLLLDNGQLDPSAPAPISNFSHREQHQWQAADRFTLSNAVSLKRVEFWGLYWNLLTNGPSNPLRDDFTIRIFADTNGSPGVQPLADFHVGRVGRKRAVRYENPDFGSYDFYAYSHRFRRAISLPAGNYWLSVVNDISVENTGVTWSAGAITPSRGSQHFRFNDGDAWFDGGEGYGIAFKLHGTQRRRAGKDCFTLQ